LHSLHVATALVVSFLGQLAIELAALHLTTAFVHCLARDAASRLLSGAKCGRCEDRKSETNSQYRFVHVITSFQS
jgi:hypothetical protein